MYGGFIVAGKSWFSDGDVSGNHGGDDYWIMKLSALTNINRETSESQSVIYLYPNPVNEALRIIGIENEYTEISIYSVDGKLIKQFNNKGINEVFVDDLIN